MVLRTSPHSEDTFFPREMNAYLWLFKTLLGGFETGEPSQDLGTRTLAFEPEILAYSLREMKPTR